jgi:hypothetical protein
MVNLSSLFRNKVVLINAVVIVSVLITIIILNTPTQMDYEELVTIPYDYTPSVYVKEWIPKPSNQNVEVKQPELFAVDYALYTATYEMQAITTKEQQAYPMSPASSMLVCSNISINDTVLVLAVKKMDTTPSVYAIVVNDKTICYFSDPFPTGYNSIVVMLKVDDDEEKVKVEIKKVKELG